MDQYTRYYVVQSVGGADVGPVYRASFRVHTGRSLGSFFRRLFRFVKPLLYSGAKAVGKEALKTGSNIISDMLNKDPEQSVGNIFKNRFTEAKDNLEHKIKNMTRSGLRLKRKGESKKRHSPSKRSKVKDIFTEKNKK